MATIWALVFAISVTGPIDDPAEHCQQVRARYQIYANRDALWVVGSRHMLNVVVDALDKELQARGWEDTAAYGDFMICSQRPAEARALTIRDVVSVKAFSNITFVRRPA